MSKEELQGVWRTIRGRRVFIRKGESLGSAMSRSGKFKNLTRTKLREVKDELSKDDRLYHKTKRCYDNRYYSKKQSL